MMTGLRWSWMAVPAVLLASVGGLDLWLSQAWAGSDDLPRRPALGVAVKAEGNGLRVLDIVPESTAAAADIQKDDLLLKLDGSVLDTPATLSRLVGTHRAADAIRLTIERDGAEIEPTVTLRERPRESSAAHIVEYGSVTSGPARLRTIVNRPKGDGRHPGILLIQGLAAASIDNPTGGMGVYRKLPETWAQAGLVTMRVEKPGIGDSTGVPCSEIDFQTELDGYRQALKALRARADVDPENLYIVGHSMGGVMAPILAGETPVRGIVVYGTAFKPWFEYLIENTRRQLLLNDAPAAEVDRAVRTLTRFEVAFGFQKQSPEEVVRDQPELKSYVAERYPDGTHEFGRHYRFFQQLGDENLAERWERVDARVLAIWGEADFVSGRDDHEAIAAVVNQNHPGQAQSLVLEDSDHGFNQAASYREALQGLTKSLPYNPAFGERVTAWVRETARTP